MADSATTDSLATPARSHPRGNRRNGGPGSEPHFPRDNGSRGTHGRGNREYRGERGGRGRGRGQPNSLTRDPTNLPLEAHTEQQHNSTSGGNFGGRLTKAASQIQDDLKLVDGEPGEKAAATEEEEGEVCFICASTIEHISIAPCNHQTCHICALRLRALYKTKACAHCRTEAEYVVFTDDRIKRYEEFVDSDFVKVDENLGTKFEKDVILDDTILLLQYNCPDKDCDVQCLSWPDLHRHVKSKHAKIMCDLCTRNKKVFTHEHELYSYGELRRHERFGDDNPGAVDQSGFKGHPECGFCKQRFYGDDELYSHCREKHERCHICDRTNQRRNPQYYLDYQELEKHFAEVHFVCLDAECQANKTNVFESEMDLKAHQLSAHPNGLSKDARRDARLVNLSGFDIRTPYQPERRAGRDHRGAGRGRDPNAEPLPVSSAQPIGRAEQAFQRQMAILNQQPIQSSQSIAPRNFGGRITQPTSAPRSQSQPQPQPTPPTANLDTLTIQDSSGTPPTNNTPQTPQEAARALRHVAVTSRATSLAHNSPTALSQFRTLVSSYRSSTITASALVERFAMDVFPNAPSSDLGILVRELADLYENEAKRQSLLEAWNGYRSTTTDAGADDYPLLPMPTGGSTSSNSSVLGGRRVLRLKSSTGPSSRSAVSRQGSWGKNALASSSGSAALSTPFPPLLGASKTKNPSTPMPWGTANHNTSKARSTGITTPSNHSAITRPPSNMGPRANDEMFPSLPAAQKPSVLMAGMTRGSVRWNDQRSGTSTPTSNAWSAAPTPAQAASASAAAAAAAEMDSGNGGVADLSDEVIGGAGAGKKKGKKGKGQVLYHFG